ncbi:hypothetical protein EK21DRAFT_67846, partial [Setomelanomma holmii]
VNMARIFDLPIELLESIFHYLGSIEDVHYFGRACRKTYGVIRRQVSYVKIMRSIISQAPQHRYDWQLSKIQRLHGEIVEQMRQSSSQLPATQNAPGVTVNQWENGLVTATAPGACVSADCSRCWPDDMIYDMLARYQGLRVLETLWLKRQLIAADFLAADEGVDADDLIHGLQSLVRREETFKDGEMASRCHNTPETAFYTTFRTDHRARFHAAITHVWLLNELRWILTNFAYPSRFDVQVAMLEMAKQNLRDQRREPLLDELDSHAIFKFIYHHLFPLHSHTLADRDSSSLPFTFSTDFQTDPAYSARLLQLFLSAGQTYFQPPDIIELMVRAEISQRPPYPDFDIPESTQHWHRSSRAFAFPANVGLNEKQYRRTLLRASLTYLNIIARSSFHQTRSTMSPSIPAPRNDQLFDIKDHANEYFLDAAMVEFERCERKADGGVELESIRNVFESRWEDGLWSVWWWANGEDKARAKMERWRDVERDVVWE